MALYEHIFVARQDISPAQVESLTDELQNIVRGLEGRVTKVEYWGLRTLQYKIKKNRKGHYTLFNIDAPAAAIVELERQLRLNEDILRYMTIRVEELSKDPSALMGRRDRDERSDRGDRDDRRDREQRS